MEVIKNKRIGKVLLIVEGGKHEFNLIKKIFVDIFGFTQIEKRRDHARYYVREKDPHSVIAVINTRTSNIASIHEREYLEKIYGELIEQHDFDIDNAAIYYLFDRDPESNTDAKLIVELMRTLKNSRENDDYIQGGMLILSYPSIEAYEISSFIDHSYEMEARLGSEIKEYINNHSKLIAMNKMDENSILHAASELLLSFGQLGAELDLDDFGRTNLQIFKQEESMLRESGTYRLLSLLSCVLMDLGMIADY